MAEPTPACSSEPKVLRCFRAYKATLEPWHEDQLDRLSIDIVSRDLDGRPVGSVLLVGHAVRWRRGDDTFAMGRKRAETVAAALKERLRGLGGSVGRIHYNLVSAGEHGEQGPNGTRTERALNRRVTVELFDAVRRKVEPKPTPIDDEELRGGVFVILGKTPKPRNPAYELWKAVHDANTNTCKRLGTKAGIEARLLCVFLTLYKNGLSDEFGADPAAQLAYVRGVAYGIVDAATERARDLSRLRGSARLRAAFAEGHGHARARILALRGARDSRDRVDAFLGRLASRRPASAVVRQVYLAALAVARGELKTMRGNVYVSSAGNCAFEYPRIRHYRCGPLSD